MRPNSLTEVRRNDRSFLRDVQLIEEELEGMPFKALLQQLADTRNLHRKLFERYQRANFKDACGNYRGEPNTSVEFWNIGQDPSRPAAYSSSYNDVGRDMFNLSRAIFRMTLDEDAESYFKKTVFIFQRFQTIHPYFDGNGHVDRLILKNLLVRHLGVRMVGDFTISPHPFTTGLQICVKNYKHNPEILESYFFNWFRY